MDLMWNSVIVLGHVLVFVYWLGGDLGAFYASRIVLDTSQPPAVRVSAARFIGAVDMAARSALILAFPTGLSVAVVKGWVPQAEGLLLIAWAIGVLWLGLAWAIHLRHAPAGGALRVFDLGVRWAAMAFLVALSLGLIAPFGPLAAFIAVKCALLACAIGLGLLVRAMLSPFAPALMALAKGENSPDVEAVLVATLGRARAVIVLIWVLLVAAAYVGLWSPL